jgi:hypothetical protein
MGQVLLLAADAEGRRGADSWQAMTRTEQIAQALKLLAPPPSEHAECRRDIETVLIWVDSRTKNLETLKATRSSDGTKALKGYKKALERLQEAYDALGLAKPWFSLGQFGQPTIVERELAKVTTFLAGSAPPKRGDAIRAKAGVDAAYLLLGPWGHKANVTRGSEWDRLGQILANTDKSVFEHIRKFRRSKPVAIKLKGKTGSALVFHRS